MWQTIGGILVALLVFGLIILIHEAGHMVVAKWMGVRVNEFSMGMGPKILAFGKGETRYTWRLFPIGGYCAMEGEDAAGSGQISTTETVSADTRSFAKKPVWRRMLIVVAGAVMNLLLGFLLLLPYYGVCTLPSDDGKTYYSSTTISQLPATAESYKTGLRAGDTIQKIDGKTVFTAWDVSMMLQNDEDGVFDMTVSRPVDGKAKTVPLKGVTFRIVKDTAQKTQYLQYDFAVKGIPQTVGSTIVQSAKTECTVAVMIWRSLGDMVTGKYGLNDLSGPVGTVGAISDVVTDAVAQTHWQDGLSNVLMMVILITVNVGIFNLLPLPALDGGRFIFLLIEAVFRKPVPAKYEGLVHVIGFALLLVLIVVVTFSDIMKFFT